VTAGYPAAAWQARRVRTLLPALLLAAVVAGCSGGGDDKSADDTPAQRLTAAKKSLDDAEYIGFTLETDSLPDGLEGLLSATGTGTHAPAFTGDVKVQASIDINAPLIAVDDTVYAKLPFVGWQEIDPDDYGAPDPAQLMATDGGISSLFTATKNATEGDKSRDGDTVLTEVEGTIPGSAVEAVFPSAGSADFTVTYALDDTDKIDNARMNGPFYDGYDDVTYDIDFDLDADEVDIAAP